MSLDKAQKISDIIFKGVITAAISAATLYLALQKHNNETVRQCDTFYIGLVNAAQQTKQDENTLQHMKFRIETYNKVCTALKDTQIKYILNSMPRDPVLVQKFNTEPAELQGWVALSRIPALKYADTNFDGIDGRNNFSKGDVIRARWTVNIREKNTPVANGDNPVIGVLDGGACMRILERVQGTFNEWARASRVDCPAGTP